MPCAKVARGIANPACVPPFQAPSAPSMPFDDKVSNNPCGKSAVGAINAVDMSSHQLCVFHLGMKLGLAELAKGPIVIEAPG